ncbi:anthrone oxygenase family protein [Streptomyces sp. NPDC048290]|uniref:anthrone oxygenase family protein n=1 Tax=Streptomyces sp. NPDC048290 TaxID=3155811 RepID=UPI003420A975
MAGTFFVFACAVMPALARGDDRTYVEVMRNINDVIQNPLFLVPFLAALPLTALAAWRRRDRLLWAATAAYALTFLITVVGNIPLNDGLAASTDPAAARERFEEAWVLWNAARAVTSTAALGLLGWRRRGC